MLCCVDPRNAIRLYPLQTEKPLWKQQHTDKTFVVSKMVEAANRMFSSGKSIQCASKQRVILISLLTSCLNFAWDPCCQSSGVCQHRKKRTLHSKRLSILISWGCCYLVRRRREFHAGNRFSNTYQPKSPHLADWLMLPILWDAISGNQLCNPSKQSTPSNCRKDVNIFECFLLLKQIIPCTW